MSESFESRLVSASSKETFKKAKQILRTGEVLCCMESAPGVLHAVCRGSEGKVARCEFRGFPKGPYSGSCDCGSNPGGLCAHSLAAALYHAKYTIKYRPEGESRDLPAQYAGLKFSGLPELLQQVLEPQTAAVEIEAETEFPHVPSKWERVRLSVQLRCGKREYFGNLNNLRQLQFGKSLSASLSLSSFPLQDRQIIRFLAINAEQEGSSLSLNSEQCAEFFHCLPGFSGFRRQGETIVIHKEPATPLLLLERVQAGYILKSAVTVSGALLPLQSVKVITGRSGCWLGMLGEYWWIPAVTDVAWLRNFLRTTVQPCDAKAAKALMEAKDSLPIQIVAASSGIQVRRKRFRPLYDGRLLPDGSLAMDIFFDYDGRLCRADNVRLGMAQGEAFWKRDTQGETEILRELVNFGFQEILEKKRKGIVISRFLLHDREAIGMFLDELIPRWLREKRPCMLSSALTSLAAGASSVALSCRVIKETADSFHLAFALSSGGGAIHWKTLAAAAENNEFFLPAGQPDVLIKIPGALRNLARTFGQSVTILPQDDENAPGADILELPRPAAALWAEAGADFPGAVPLEFLRIKVDLDRLREDLAVPDRKPAPELFQGELRPYQAAGVYWLAGMFERSCNLILADEMGLGKTIQTLAALVLYPKLTLPAIVICPTSLAANWRREAGRFTPSLRVEVIEGHDRKDLWDRVPAADLCICSYALVKRDMHRLAPLSFRTLILDEAQHIKNPSSANAQKCKEIRAEHRLVLTGTPLENSAEDLWSIFDFLHPGFLGPLSPFRARFANLSCDPALREELAFRIAPFILRRKKSEVCRELPPKQEQIVYCEMHNGQRALYDALAEEAVKQCSAMRSRPGRSFELLSLLMRLRQTCCAPDLLPPDLIRTFSPDGSVPGSAKMELLQELLMETIDSGHKVLLFSQFTSLLAIIRSWLESRAVPYEYLDGSTQDRMARVDSFNHSPGIPVFLLSLKAGGTGLNLTSADTVIICDPWWNPAAEIQATDRTHRIGQTKNVNCIKLVVKDSIEERVLELQRKKQELFASLVDETGDAMGALSLEDFEFLLQRG
ncbi:MAG: DEAD/DEAH box helicase [Lentisphaeria bacterium]|nr:DEAD/DEAH box helicase [Lentisphaeria bacterium]